MINDTFLKFAFFLLLFGFTIQSKAQDSTKTIPAWFLEDISAQVGIWKTDNSVYQSAEEPFEAYGMEWTWGIGETSIIGRLYGIKDGKETGDFWQFRQYWDIEKQEVILAQYGHGGTVGIGVVKLRAPGKTETLQNFFLVDGQGWVSRHLNEMSGGELTTVSYELLEDKTWKERRNYTWTQQK